MNNLNLPKEYLKRMRTILKDDFSNYINSFADNINYGIRINTLKINANEIHNLLNMNLEKIKWCDTGFYYNIDYKLSKDIYYNAGLYYIQEPSAMCVASMLSINEFDKVLDICSAPGGKATHIACKLNNTGLLIANDISASRCKALSKNLELCGAKNTIITSENPKNLARKFNNYFDKIIVDAPCSGEGMFRRDKTMIKSWNENDFLKYHNIQKEILNYAKDMLNFGGTIVYSTCTFSPYENEQIINDFLNDNEDFTTISLNENLGFTPCNISVIEGRINKNVNKTYRLMPHKVKGEGHFIALLKHNGENFNSNKESLQTIKPIKNEFIVPIKKFFDNELNIPISDNLYIHKNSVFSVPLGIDMSGIRVVKSGLHIGELKNGRFEPSQAFAMSLRFYNAKNILNLSKDSELLLRYRKGESFVIDSLDEGWFLVCVNTFPIGWGKVKNKRLKNKYSKSLMI